jgi:SAGA-associated factor 29
VLTSIFCVSADGDETDSDLEDELARLSRENISLCEQIEGLLRGQSDNDNSILGSIDILKALRQSSENDPLAAPPQRAAANPKPSRIKSGRSKVDTSSVLSADDRESLAADSPIAGPSPKHPVVPPTQRIKTAASRAGSVPIRETSVKVEDGIDSGADLQKSTCLFYLYISISIHPPTTPTDACPQFNDS